MDKYLNKFHSYLYSPFLLTDTSQTLTCTLPFIPNCLPMYHWISNTIPTLNPSYLLPITPHLQHSYTSHHILSDTPNTLSSITTSFHNHIIYSFVHSLYSFTLAMPRVETWGPKMKRKVNKDAKPRKARPQVSQMHVCFKLEYPKMHVWCEIWVSYSNPWLVIIRTR